jgi:hypothetical protein
MDPIPDPLLHRKFGSAGNRTRDLWVSSQELWPLDHRGSPIIKICMRKHSRRVPCSAALDITGLRVTMAPLLWTLLDCVSQWLRCFGHYWTACHNGSVALDITGLRDTMAPLLWTLLDCVSQWLRCFGHYWTPCHNGSVALDKFWHVLTVFNISQWVYNSITHFKNYYLSENDRIIYKGIDELQQE